MQVNIFLGAAIHLSHLSKANQVALLFLLITCCQVTHMNNVCGHIF